jgi:hypothetical protein
MHLADACIYVGTIPLNDALVWGGLGLLGAAMVGFGVGAWWARG